MLAVLAVLAGLKFYFWGCGPDRGVSHGGAGGHLVGYTDAVKGEEPAYGQRERGRAGGPGH